MKHVGLVVLLVTLWILAWGQITLANLLSGVIVTVGLFIAFPPRRGRRTVRTNIVGIVRLVAYVVAQIVAANAVMTRHTLRRRTMPRAGVLAHALGRPSEELATVMSSIIALSPGTMTVDVDADSSVIYIHFFDLRDIDSARVSLTRLEARVVAAIASQHPKHEDSP